MRGLIITFLGAFFFIWALGSGIGYLQKMYRGRLDTRANYGDFSPQEIERQRKKTMDDYRQQMENYRRQQTTASSQEDIQKKFMEDQKRQMENMKRISNIR